ncbi:hypothetical protein IV203_029342 [Nitzschia inconspicua]|uniref:Uncharacterized protein n=1 Tax=Nitzschia inconspicua TaxID=303405 RepID=A0A9K3Q0B7_9STRA|nr:hypothetical protein IV203_029342 [Nitzschia inconspicua]
MVVSSVNTNSVHAQIDTGAFASCSYQLDYLHDYAPFTADNPCPTKLIPALEGADTIPDGVGYMHIPT